MYIYTRRSLRYRRTRWKRRNSLPSEFSQVNLVSVFTKVNTETLTLYLESNFHCFPSTKAWQLGLCKSTKKSAWVNRPDAIDPKAIIRVDRVGSTDPTFLAHHIARCENTRLSRGGRPSAATPPRVVHRTVTHKTFYNFNLLQIPKT